MAEREIATTCPYCGVGCGVLVGVNDGQITSVRGDPQHPANFGRLCSKGQALHLTSAVAVTRQTRLLRPQGREHRRAPLKDLAWPEAIAMASQRIAEIVRTHGPDSIGFHVSGQLLTEDYYVFNKLAKGLLGTNNIDSNSRLCMSSAVAGYKQTLGADAPPTCYEDLALADCLFIAGSNTAWAHPILFRRIEQAREARPQMKMVVVDPRRTDTARMADLHLALQPGTDVLLYQGLLHLMLREGWTQPGFIARHTQGFEALSDRVQHATPDVVAQICGLNLEDLLTAARWFATSPATLSLYCQGLNQSTSGTANNVALIELHLATAQIGRPGAGPFSLTGQPNAMGGREVGAMANLLSGHRDLANPDHRHEVARLWGVPEVPARPGLTAVELFQAAADGAVKALWIVCTNPAQSMPDQATVRRALQRAEFVVVQEAYRTASTCDYADLLLPASSWGEKEGTVTNSERRISRVRAAVTAPGMAQADWWIAARIGQALAQALGRPRQTRLFDYDSPCAIWEEHRESTRGRDLDITGLSYAALERDGPAQWPCPEHAPHGTSRLYTDLSFATPDGRARFVVPAWQPTAEERDTRYPFSLTTGRLRDQWHGMTRTATAARLFAHAPEPCIQMNADDMRRLGLSEDDLVQVRSRRGTLALPARSSDELKPSQTFIAMHWGSEVLGGRSKVNDGFGVNALTVSAFCPTSRQPELKHSAIEIRKLDWPWSLTAMVWLSSEEIWAAQNRLRPLLDHFDAAWMVPFAQPDEGLMQLNPASGLRIQARHATAPDLLKVAALAEALIPETPAGSTTSLLQYNDPRRASLRRLHIARTDSGLGRLSGFVCAGDSRPIPWLRAALESGEARSWGARDWLRADAAGPADAGSLQPPRAPQVCNCFNVREDAILETLREIEGSETQRLSTLQRALQCGTQCGSCIPSLRALVRGHPGRARSDVNEACA